MLWKFSGASAMVLLVSIVIAIISFFILTKDLKLPLLPAAVLAGAFPVSTMTILLRLVVGKPRHYILRWLQYQQLKHNNQSLLTETHSHEK